MPPPGATDADGDAASDRGDDEAGDGRGRVDDGDAGERTERGVLVLNPTSGSEDHVDDVVELAGTYGLEVRRTEAAGDGVALAREAAPEADLIAAAGGDGTVNEVVNGIVDADALASTTLAVVPAGTGDNFATNVGIEDIEHAFEVIADGRRRRLDLGVANGRSFVNSCVGGVTARASGETSSERKRELGVLAYVTSTVETVSSFDSLPLRVETAAGPDGDAPRAWEGEALFVLVGNCRRFTGARAAQANVEDGAFEVTIVEDAPARDIVGDAALEWLFDADGAHLVRRRTPSLVIESRSGPVEYSLDGEMLETETLHLETRAGALEVAVGEAYRPEPSEGRWPVNAVQ